MKLGKLGLADRVALVALGGIILSLFVWLTYAVVDGVLFGGTDLTSALVTPAPMDAWNRLVAIVVVLIGTLVIQVMVASRLQAAHQLEVERGRTRQMYENSPDSVICMSADRSVVYANPTAEHMAGVRISGDEGRACHEVLYGLSQPCRSCGLDTVLESGVVHRGSHRAVLRSGEDVHLATMLYPIMDATGSIDSVVEVTRDVSDLHDAQARLQRVNLELEKRVDRRTKELQRANEQLLSAAAERQQVAAALAESEARYRQIVERSPDMVLVHTDERVTYINPAGLRLLGVDAVEDLESQTLMSLWKPNGSGLSFEEFERALLVGDLDRPVTLKLKRPDGGLVDVEVTVSRVSLDGEDFVQCVARDITERIRAEDTIRRMAFYDTLTGLPNRQLFRDRLSHALARAQRSGTTLAVAFLDLDDFKAINDTLGHSVGDDLLRSVGERIGSLLREADTVARHSGDEFTVIADIGDSADGEALARRLIDGLRPGFMIQGHDLHVTCSLGVALYPNHGAGADELLRSADTAMYHAKALGQSAFALYRPEMGEAARDRLALETELRRGIEGRQFELYYQPQVDLETRRIVGVEALLRWNHPDRGIVAPGEFLRVAEQAGLIGHLGRWVLAESCTQLRTWLDDGVVVGRMAVNLSAQEFLHHEVVECVAQTLAWTRIPPEMLELEITESVAIGNLDVVLATLSELRAMGVRIAIDDFGTGYSSMGYLQRFPIQTLKIAQTFMRGVHSNEQSAAIATMLIELCRSLDLDIVAEGVERTDQLEFLEAHGALTAQGNLFCPALPADEVARVLKTGLPVSA